MACWPAWAADPPHGFAKRPDHRFGTGVIRLITAAHDRQDTAFRPGLAAGNRRINKAKPGLGSDAMELLDRHISRGGGVIDKIAPSGYPGKGPVITEGDRPQGQHRPRHRQKRTQPLRRPKLPPSLPPCAATRASALASLRL